MTELALNALNQGDYETYLCFCDVRMTSFEPENLGNLVDNADYRRFCLHQTTRPIASNARANSSSNSNYNNHQQTHSTDCRARQYSLLLNPAVHVLSDDAAAIAYVRLTHAVDPQTGRQSTEQTEETRVWQRSLDNKWTCVHFHKSVVGVRLPPAAATAGQVKQDSEAPR